MKPISIVAVHGVGNALPGEIMVELSALHRNALSGSGLESRASAFIREDLVLEGTVYPRLKHAGKEEEPRSIDEIIEMHWAFIRRPSESVIGVLQYLVYIPLAMALLTCCRSASSKRVPWVARAHFWTFGMTYLWLMLASIMVMSIISCGITDHRIVRWTLAGLFPALMAGLVWFLRRYHPSFNAGIFWAIGAMLVGIFLNVSPGTHVDIVAATGFAYGRIQTILSATFLISLIEAAVIQRGFTATQRLARAGFAWIPFLLFCGIVAASWAGALKLADSHLDHEAYAGWSIIFLKHLPFNLRIAEISLMVATLAATLIPAIVGVACYFVPGRLRRIFQFPPPGQAGQNVIPFSLWFGPVAILTAYLVICVFGRENNDNENILDIYKLSALRLYALLPLLIPAMREILHAVGDVVFHIIPPRRLDAKGPTHPDRELSSKEQIVPRLSRLLVHLRESRPDHRIIVFAHSQGTVVAYEALRRNHVLADMLVTMGSPIASLYARFLGPEFRVIALNKTTIWNNLFRSGDYIGGPIPGVERTSPICAGGHTNYWSDPVVHKLLQSLMFL